MITITAFFGGAVWGVLLARRRGGNRLDMAQHAASLGIACGLLGLFATIFIHRILT